MNNVRMKRIKGLALTVIALGFGMAVYAQIGPPPTPTTPPTQVPLDGGVIILAVAGAAYGAKKVYNKRKSKA
jgi:hypothetical protein